MPRPLDALLVALALLPGIAIALEIAFGFGALFGYAHNIGILIVLALAACVLRLAPARLSPAARLWFVLAGLAAAWMLLSVFLVAASPATAGFGTVMLFSGALSGVVAFGLAQRDHGRFFRLFLLAVVVGNLATVLLPAVIHLLHTPPEPFRAWSHAMPGFGHIRRLGHFTVMAIAAGCGLYLIAQNPRHRHALIVALALLWMIAFWGGARATAAALLLGLPLALAITRAARLQDWIALAGAAVAGGTLSLFLSRPDTSFGMIQRLLRDRVRLSSGASPGDISTGRSSIWEWALERIAETPLTGIGYNQIGVLGKPPLLVYHAHNFPLEMLLGYGIVFGTLILGLVAALVVVAGGRSWGRRDSHQAAGLMLVLALGIYAMFCATLYYAVPLSAFAIGLAMALAPAKGCGIPERRHAA